MATAYSREQGDIVRDTPHHVPLCRKEEAATSCVLVRDQTEFLVGGCRSFEVLLDESVLDSLSLIE